MNEILSMWQKGRRRADDTAGQPDGCLSDLALDRLARSEGPLQERELAQGHLQSCRACAQARDALEDDRRRFDEQIDVPALARDALARHEAGRIAVRARIARWLAPVVGLAMAAGAVALFAGRADRGGDELRAKGGLAIELFVKHAETAGDGRLHLGEALHPGDRVRVRLTGAGQEGALARAGDGQSDGRSYLAVLAVDVTGRVSVYHPQAGSTARLAEPGASPLPSAVELDGTLGSEVILAFACPSPLAVDTLVAAVQQATDRGRVRTDPAAAVGAVQSPCVSARYRIEKVPTGATP